VRVITVASANKVVLSADCRIDISNVESEIRGGEGKLHDAQHCPKQQPLQVFRDVGERRHRTRNLLRGRCAWILHSDHATGVKRKTAKTFKGFEERK
jgi:hypothetical protein